MKLLQRLLLLRESGTFDEPTRRAVIAFQEARDWLHPATGGVGPKTWAALDGRLSADATGAPQAAADGAEIDHVVTGQVVVDGKELGEGKFIPAAALTDRAVKDRTDQIASAGAAVLSLGNVSVGTMALRGVATVAPAPSAAAGGGAAAALATGAIVLIGAIVVAGTILIVASVASQAKDLGDLGGTSLPGGIDDAPVSLRVGDQIRSNTVQLAIHLARVLGSDVGGMPPDHQGDPERDRPHWWKEILNFIRQVSKEGLTPKQLGRELSKRFTKEQFDAIIAALKKAAELLGKDPPDFPPVAFP